MKQAGLAAPLQLVSRERPALRMAQTSAISRGVFQDLPAETQFFCFFPVAPGDPQSPQKIPTIKMDTHGLASNSSRSRTA